MNHTLDEFENINSSYNKQLVCFKSLIGLFMPI